jgi:uncharacterized protein YecE (DUF72 family)
MDQPMIRLGTSAFTAAGWEGSFYPGGMKPADYLSYYAKHFNSVELDNTFYRAPSKTVVEGWARKTPEDFVFAAKVPQVIIDRRAELTEWADILGKVRKRKIQIFAYANNHHAGHGPATVEMFRSLMHAIRKLDRRKTLA